MKRLQIFKAGTHTSAAGQEISFSDDHVSQTATSYNPELHEAPIVIGHPKDNGPAYGWIKSLAFEEGALEAEPQQVNEDFQEMVNSGAFKKISASFYHPDSPQNPVPGSYYLRHVGFLGAQAPAVKGMRTPEFNEADEGVIEFSDVWAKHSTAGIFQRLRDWMIENFGKDTADSVIPQYDLDDIKDNAKEAMSDYSDPEQDPTPANHNNDPAPNSEPTEDNTMTEVEKLQAKLDQANADKDTLTNENQQLKDENASFKEAAAQQEQANLEAKIDQLIADGKVLPAEKADTLAYAQSLDNTVEIEFGEGDDKQAIGQRDHFLAILEKRSKQVDFNEYGDQGEPKEFANAQELSQAALNYQAEQAEKGITVDIATAVNHVKNN